MYNFIIESALLFDKRLSKKTLLEFLHSVEGDSESYFKQRDKIYDSVRVNGRKSILYKGQFGFFTLKIKLDRNRVIKWVGYVEKLDNDLF